MSFTLEETKNGRDIILFNNYKYRKGHSVKSGDITWKCLGRVCKATIKTNREKTTILFSNDTHTGAHPVTLQSMTPTPPKSDRMSVSSKVTITTVAPTTPASAATPVTDATHVAATTPVTTPTLETAAPATSVIPVSLFDSVGTNSPYTSIQDILRENSALKNEVENLRLEKQVILNHSIESDQRLLEFTDTLFLPPQPSSLNTDQAQLNCAQNNNKDKKDLEEALAKITMLEDEIKRLQRPCGICAILKDETNNMIQSIKCLEEENKVLKCSIMADAANPTHDLPSFPHSLKLHNNYKLMSEGTAQEADNMENFVTVSNKGKGNRKDKHKKAKIQQFKADYRRDSKAKSIHFKSVSVIGDSHARGLATLVGRHLGDGVSVTGFVKPGGRLLNIEPTSPPPEDHCYVVIAGTNDVGAGGAGSAFAHLEKVLQTCIKSSRVLMVPLPTRYDLRHSSPVHDAVDLVNGFMTELTHRHQGAELLDTSGIHRRHHTTHGLHLNGSGKRQLARLVAEGLASMSQRPKHCNQAARLTAPRHGKPSRSTPCGPYVNILQPSIRAAIKTPVLHPTGAPHRRPYTSPTTLPYETYAEAAARSTSSLNSPANCHRINLKKSTNCSNTFLDNATPTVKQN